jgi:hypothetical protein
MQIRKTRSQLREEALTELRLILADGQDSPNPITAAHMAKGYVKCLTTMGFFQGGSAQLERRAFMEEIDKLYMKQRTLGINPIAQ